jgi:F-type H+-transporting ATPase subunit b
MIVELFKDPDFWEWLGLIIVVGIILYRRVPALLGAMLDARAAAITKELDQARALREEAQTLLVDYRQRAERAQSEAANILTESRAEAERFAAESREQLKAQLERRAKQAQDKIAQAEAQALADIRALAADMAVEAAEKLLAARLDEKRSSALVEGSIKDLSAKLN